MNSGIKGWLYHSTAIDTALIEQKYKAKYKQLNESRIDTSLPANSMQHIVQTVDLIQKKYLNDPEQMLTLVSQDISIFSDLRVKKIDWFVSNYADNKEADAVAWGKKSRQVKAENSKITNTNGLCEIAVVAS